NPGSDTITFDPTVFSNPNTIILGGTQLDLSDTSGATTILGPAVGVTVSGNNASRVFQVDASVTASLSGLTVSGGKTSSSGGGVANSGNLTLTDCTITGNSATGSGVRGGGLFSSGTATLINCIVSANS